jgi:nitroimidazol reductase NimA-like FMN-containing flavoprotein (pyridoxamine 5'-phosphate oxidase superfamily)
MELDRHGMGVLDAAESRARLGRNGIGRVAVSVGALPAIFPVAFAQRDGDIYFRTTPGTKLAAATANTIVAFEVDRVDPMMHGGWSVLVVGRAAEVTRPEELEELRSLPLTRWAPGAPESLVRIHADRISGRVLPTPDVGPWPGPIEEASHARP